MGTRRRRDILLFLTLAVFVAPTLVFAVAVIGRADQAQPHVRALRAEADELGLEVMPEGMFAIDMMDPDDVPPGAVAQDEFVGSAINTFHGNPVDGQLLYWPLLITASAVLTIWTLIGLAVLGAVGGRWANVAGLTTIATLALLWLPQLYYRGVIDVVSWYVD